MLNFNDQGGILEVISGCMFAGKTETLIRRVRVLRINKKVAIFKPLFDKRDMNKTHYSYVQSHGKNSVSAIVVPNLEFLKNHLKTNQYDVLAFDEMQFFPPEFAYFLEELAQNGQKILCAGLDKGFNDQFFTTMMILLSLADVVVKLHAVCFKCGFLATKTQRIDPTTRKEIPPKVVENVIGGADVYEARCRNCFKFFPENDIYAKI